MVYSSKKSNLLRKTKTHICASMMLSFLESNEFKILKTYPFSQTCSIFGLLVFSCAKTKKFLSSYPFSSEMFVDSIPYKSLIISLHSSMVVLGLISSPGLNTSIFSTNWLQLPAGRCRLVYLINKLWRMSDKDWDKRPFPYILKRLVLHANIIAFSVSLQRRRKYKKHIPVD